MAKKTMKRPANKPKESATGKPGDWISTQKTVKPNAYMIEMAIPDVDAIYAEFAKTPDPYPIAMQAIESGKEQVLDAVLYCGRFNQQGRLLREAGVNPYRLVHVRGDAKYREAMSHLKECWSKLPGRIREAQRKAAWVEFKKNTGGKYADFLRESKKFREDWGGGGWSGGGAGFGAPYQSNSDLGSNQGLDPNQFTEFTPWFSGPFYKNIPYAYFPGMASAREAVNHHPIAHRIVQILVQYALGRGFDIRCKKDGLMDKWNEFCRENKLKHKIRKFWAREYITDGELTVDKARMISIDASTIMDVVCEGWDEYIDKPLYLQQMFQTATQVYAGIDVPGVPKSGDTKPGKWIVRQIPIEQVIRIRGNCTSQEKRGRPFIFSILGWLKKLKDTYTGQILSEQLQACFVYDDEIDGSAADVEAHGLKYSYIPVSPSIFVHNKAVKRTPLQPTANRSGGQSNIAQEVLALLATSMGFPKDFFNVMASGSGSRATAIVGSEPFTKVIEDLQQDFEDLLDSIIATFCKQEGEDYDEKDWQIIFPSVSKDSAKDYIGNVATAQSMGYINKRRAGTMVAAELECDNYDFDDEQEKDSEDAKTYPPIASGLMPPKGRFGATLPEEPGGAPEPSNNGNPLHGPSKNSIKSQHKIL